MRIVIFINTSWNIYNFRTGLIGALQEKGYEIHAMAPEDPYSDRLPALGCIYHPIAMDNTGSNFLRDLALVHRIYGLYRSIRPDLVLNYTIKPNIYGALVARMLGIPCINNVSGLGTVFLSSGGTSRVAKWLYRWAFRYPHHIFFQNQWDRQVFLDQGLLVANNHSLIPGSGINCQRFQSNTHPPPAPPMIFLMMARLLQEKGVREYYQASQILLEEKLPVECRLLGAADPGHRQGIPLDELQSWQASGAINYLGETDDVRPYIQQAHAVVLPSYREGLSRCLLEAASMSRPIIATDVPGCAEVVKNQINGLLCKPQDPQDLADKMRALYHTGFRERELMGKKGRELVKQNFDESLVIGAYLTVIERIRL